MWIVCEGQKIRNVNARDKVQNFYSGDLLPEDYTPPESYIKNKIVEEVKENVNKNRKTR